MIEQPPMAVGRGLRGITHKMKILNEYITIPMFVCRVLVNFFDRFSVANAWILIQFVHFTLERSRKATRTR